MPRAPRALGERRDARADRRRRSSTASRCSRTLPEVTRATSSRSSTSRARWSRLALDDLEPLASCSRSLPVARELRWRARSRRAGCAARGRASRGTGRAAGSRRAPRTGGAARAAPSCTAAEQRIGATGRSSIVTLPSSSTASTCGAPRPPRAAKHDQREVRPRRLRERAPRASIGALARSSASCGDDRAAAPSTTAAESSSIAQIARGEQPWRTSTGTRARRRGLAGAPGRTDLVAVGHAMVRKLLGWRRGTPGSPSSTPRNSRAARRPRCPAAPSGQLADRVLVGAGALLDHRDRLAHAPAGLEVAQQHDGVGEVADVDRAS